MHPACVLLSLAHGSPNLASPSACHNLMTLGVAGTETCHRPADSTHATAGVAIFAPDLRETIARGLVEQAAPSTRALWSNHSSGSEQVPRHVPGQRQAGKADS